VARRSHWFAMGDPDGDNRPTLADGTKYTIGNPEERNPAESWESRMARENLEEKEKMALRLWHQHIEFIDQGIIPVAPEEKLSLAPEFFMTGIFQEGLRFAYGKKADWRVVLCILARKHQEDRRELSWRLTKAAAEANTKELEAFAKATKLIRRVETMGEGGMFRPAQFHALLFVIECFRRSGSTPKQNEVRAHLIKENISIPSRNNESTHLFCGPVLGKLQKGKAGRPRK